MLNLNPRTRDVADVTAMFPAARPVTHEEIARRAFEIYCERSHHDGGDLDDWLQAERECAEACAPVVAVRLRLKADRRLRGGPAALVDRRRQHTL